MSEIIPSIYIQVYIIFRKTNFFANLSPSSRMMAVHLLGIPTPTESQAAVHLPATCAGKDTLSELHFSDAIIINECILFYHVNYNLDYLCFFQPHW